MSFYKDYLKKKESEKKKTFEGMFENVDLKNKTNEETIIIEKSPEGDMAADLKIEKVKDKILELQKREEEERQKFLKRVKNEEPSLIVPDKEEAQTENLPIYLAQKPPRGHKFFIRIIIILGLVLVIGAIFLVWYQRFGN